MNDIIKNVFDKGLNFVDFAGTKGLELWDCAKLRLYISQLQSKINHKYIMLGKKTHSLISKNEISFDDEMLSLSYEINKDKKALLALKEELAERSGKKLCASCNHKNDSTSEFCGNCGNRI